MSTIAKYIETRTSATKVCIPQLIAITDSRFVQYILTSQKLHSKFNAMNVSDFLYTFLKLELCVFSAVRSF